MSARKGVKAGNKQKARAGGFEDDEDEMNDRLSDSQPQEIKMGNPRFKNNDKHEPVVDNKYNFKGKAK